MRDDLAEDVCMKRLQVGLRAFTVLISAMNRSWRHCGVVLMGEKLGPIGEGGKKRAPPARYLWRGAVLLLIVLDELQAIKAVS
jgi:hypothetical protein